MASKRLVFRVHALQRMFQRGITVEDVHLTIAGGELVEDYPDDIPYPSRLVLGWRGTRPVHVVLAHNHDDDEIIVITAYEPNADQWNAGFKRRKR